MVIMKSYYYLARFIPFIPDLVATSECNGFPYRGTYDKDEIIFITYL